MFLLWAGYVYYMQQLFLPLLIFSFCMNQWLQFRALNSIFLNSIFALTFFILVCKPVHGKFCLILHMYF
jgi:hypothetical protein